MEDVKQKLCHMVEFVLGCTTTWSPNAYNLNKWIFNFLSNRKCFLRRQRKLQAIRYHFHVNWYLEYMSTGQYNCVEVIYEVRLPTHSY